MRVLLNRARSRDDGAITIIVAVSMLALILVTAFVTDFGLAYYTKRQLQTGADGAVLAAGNYYAAQTGTSCDTIRTAGTSTAQTIANRVGNHNVSDDANQTYSDQCLGSGLALETYFSHTATRATLFGAMVARQITTGRDAKSQVRVPPGVAGLRPYMICVPNAQSLRAAGTTAIQVVYFPGTGCGSTPGNWFPVECPKPDDGNSDQDLADNTFAGCSQSIYAVDTNASPQTTPPSDATPAVIQSREVAQCASEPKTSSSGLPGNPGPPQVLQTGACLVGDTGNNMTSNPVSTAWTSLLDKIIVLPLFDQATVHNKGSNTWYPVAGFISVQVCGYQWQGNGKSVVQRTGTSPDCKNAVQPPTPTQPDYLLLRYTNIVFGGSSSPSTCRLGDPTCDFGRSVFLTQ